MKYAQPEKDINQNQQSNSDNDEGFVINQIQIKQKKSSRKINNQERPLDYQARYVSGSGIRRKEIPEALHKFHHFLDQDINPKEIDFIYKKKKKQHIMHPYERYFGSQNYVLLYSRSQKQKINLTTKNDNYSKNQIQLSCMSEYSAENYSAFKAFENSQPKISFSHDLQFDSRFQCGNLCLAFKHLHQVNSYVLFMQNDTNTNGYNRWFYFSVRNAKKGSTYKFSVVNFRKKFTFFNEGLKPCIFSLGDFKQHGNGWSRKTKNVRFQRSYLSSLADPQQNTYYSLKFEMICEHENDLNLISIGLPYSYTRLMTFLLKLEGQNTKQPEGNVSMNLTTIAYSLANNQVPMVTISAFKESSLKESSSKYFEQSVVKKKVIILLARQHPGETWSSFFMEEMLNELVHSNSSEKKWLLDHFIFKIFPMINVDGVVYGNFRCDVAGMDLNRNWKHPSKQLHPQIWSIKQEIIRLASEYEVVGCLDFHGHSKDYNIFCYSCKTDNNSCRVLPYMFSKINQKFDFQACTFGISKYKESTARAVIYGIIKNVNVLTIESSFFGTKAFNKKQMFQPVIFQDMAKSILQGLSQYLNQNQDFKAETEIIISQHIKQFLQIQKNNICNDSGSDSDPECDEICLKQKLGKIIPKFIEQTLFQEQDDSEKEEELAENSKKANSPQKKKRKEQTRIFTKNNFRSIQTNRSKKEELNTLEITARSKETSFRRTSIEKNDKFRGKIKIEKSFVEEKSPENKIQSSMINAKQPFQKQLKLEPLNFNESVELKKNVEALKKAFAANQFHSKQLHSTKYEMQYQVQAKKQQELPILCILSDKKKQLEMDRIKKSKQEKQKKSISYDNTPIIRYEPVLVINKRIEAMEKLKERQKDSNNLLSAIWRQNFLKYGEHKSKHIFYGGD